MREREHGYGSYDGDGAPIHCKHSVTTPLSLISLVKADCVDCVKTYQHKTYVAEPICMLSPPTIRPLCAYNKTVLVWAHQDTVAGIKQVNQCCLPADRDR